MFFSNDILVKKGPLANVWLAAHWDKKLSKVQINQTNVVLSVNSILEGKVPPMALRLSGQLLLGFAKIYWRKAKYLYDDCNDALFRIKVTITAPAANASNAKESNSNVEVTSISIPITAKDLNMLLPEPEINLETILENSQKLTGMPDKSSISIEMPMDMQFGQEKELLGFNLEEADDLLKEFDIEIPRRASVTGNIENKFTESILSPLKKDELAEAEIERRASIIPDTLNDVWGSGFDEIISHENANPNISVMETKKVVEPIPIQLPKAKTRSTGTSSLATDTVIDLNEDNSFAALPEMEIGIDLIPDDPQERAQRDLIENFTFDSFIKNSLCEVVGDKLANILLSKAQLATPTKRKLEKLPFDEMKITSPLENRVIPIPEETVFEGFGGGSFENEIPDNQVFESPLRKMKTELITESLPTQQPIDKSSILSTESAVNQIADDSFYFDKIVATRGVHDVQGVAESFLDLLVLCSNGKLNVEQNKPFGEIKITKIK